MTLQSDHDMFHKLMVVGAVIVGFLDFGLAAQAPRYTFDVVSIKKRLEPLRPPVTNVISGSVFRMPEVTVAELVRYAWQIRDFQLVGGPEWMRTDRFEVEARAPDDTPSRDQVRLMVRSMLEERFELVVHWEQRELPYYSLELARTDGRLGPYLQRWDDCSKRPTDWPNWAVGTSWRGCGSLSDVAISASFAVDRPVIDATGLVGTFQYGWHIPPDPLTESKLGASSLLPRSLVINAMEEHLGLTLEATQGPFDVLVVDSLQQPTEN